MVLQQKWTSLFVTTVGSMLAYVCVLRASAKGARTCMTPCMRPLFEHVMPRSPATLGWDALCGGCCRWPWGTHLARLLLPRPVRKHYAAHRYTELWPYKIMAHRYTELICSDQTFRELYRTKAPQPCTRTHERASRRAASHLIASHRISSHLIASHRTSSHLVTGRPSSTSTTSKRVISSPGFALPPPPSLLSQCEPRPSCRWLARAASLLPRPRPPPRTPLRPPHTTDTHTRHKRARAFLVHSAGEQPMLTCAEG